MDKEEEKVVLDNEHEEIALDTDILVNLAVNIRGIEYTLRKCIKRFRGNYDMYIRYHCDRFDINSLNGCGISFYLELHNKATGYKDVFPLDFDYSDILSTSDVVVEKIVEWFNEVVEFTDEFDTKGVKGE